MGRDVEEEMGEGRGVRGEGKGWKKERREDMI